MQAERSRPAYLCPKHPVILSFSTVDGRSPAAVGHGGRALTGGRLRRGTFGPLRSLGPNCPPCPDSGLRGRRLPGFSEPRPIRKDSATEASRRRAFCAHPARETACYGGSGQIISPETPPRLSRDSPGGVRGAAPRAFPRLSAFAARGVSVRGGGRALAISAFFIYTSLFPRAHTARTGRFSAGPGIRPCPAQGAFFCTGAGVGVRGIRRCGISKKSFNP